MAFTLVLALPQAPLYASPMLPGSLDKVSTQQELGVEESLSLEAREG